MTITWPTNYSGDTIKGSFELLLQMVTSWVLLRLEQIFDLQRSKTSFSPLSRKINRKMSFLGGNLLAYNF